MVKVSLVMNGQLIDWACSTWMSGLLSGRLFPLQAFPALVDMSSLKSQTLTGCCSVHESSAIA